MAYSRTLNHFTSMQELATIWASSTSYLVNQPVIHNNFLYRCAVAHTSSGSFQTDLAAGNWERVSSAENAINWASGVYYVLNQLVIDNDKLYKCLVAHTSGGSFIADLQSAYWVEISKSEAGVFNYVENADAEVDTLGWSTYADAAGAQPVDGTGGSPTVTFTRSITTPLRGDASFNFAKDAADRQGEGVAYDITVDNADLAKVLTVTFDYEVLSGTYATGDLTVYLIQDPSGTPLVIQPAGYQVQAGTVGTKLKHIATFQTASNVNDYRLCIHVASTSASAYTLAIDNVVVGPQVVQYGAPVTDWQEYTPIITASTTNPTLPTSGLTKNRAIWRRVGGSIEIHYEFETSSPTGGNNGSGNYSFSLPPGINYDTSKLAATIALYAVAVGVARFGFRDGFISVSPAVGTDKFSIVYEDAGVTTATLTSAQALFTASNAISAHFTLPILGWSSTVQMSNDTDTRVVAAIYNRDSGTQALTANVTDISFPTLQQDTHSAWNGSQFTAPVAGFYCINGSIQLSAQVAAKLNAYKNGLIDIALNENRGTDEIKHFSGTVFLNAGDTISVRSGQAVTVAPSTGGNVFISIYRLSGPSAIAASETVAAGYLMTTSQSVTANVTPMNFSTKLYDSHGAVTTGASWNFTAPVSGLYSISGYFLPIAQASAYVYKNSSVYQRVAFAAASEPGALSGTISLLAGDVIEFRSTATTSIVGATLAAGGSYVNITRVGNYV